MAGDLDDKTLGGLLFGRHDRHEDAENKLLLKAKYRALNIPDEDDLHVDKSRHWHGISTGGMLGVVGLMGASIALVALAITTRSATPIPPVQHAPITATTPHGVEWKVEIFRDKDGKLGQRVTPVTPAVEPGK